MIVMQKLFFFALMLLLVTSTNGFAQKTTKGTPILNKNEIDSLRNIIPSYVTRELDNSSLQKMAAIENKQKGTLPYAQGISLNIDLKKDGLRIDVPNGSVYLYEIISPNALSLETHFKYFEIPQGAKVFLYNPSQSKILGALTHKNNRKNKMLSCSMIKGNTIIIEYFEPINTNGTLIIDEVGHVFIDMLG